MPAPAQRVRICEFCVFCVGFKFPAMIAKHKRSACENPCKFVPIRGRIKIIELLAISY